MRQCLSCRNRTSEDRCPHSCLRTMIVCNRHARTKNIRLWFRMHSSIVQGVIKIQSLFRGFILRNRLRLCGPGVLCRSICHNDEDLITCEQKNTVNPFDFFSIVDGGETFWFDQRTMIEWSQKNVDVTNPYTRSLLSVDDTRRLRELQVWRIHVGTPCYHTVQNITSESRRDVRWLRIAQILRENSFDEAHPEIFLGMPRGQLLSFIEILKQDMREWCVGRRKRFYIWIAGFRGMRILDEAELSADISGLLLAILTEHKNSFQFCFFIWAAYVKCSSLWIN